MIRVSLLAKVGRLGEYPQISSVFQCVINTFLGARVMEPDWCWSFTENQTIVQAFYLYQSLKYYIFTPPASASCPVQKVLFGPGAP